MDQPSAKPLSTLDELKHVQETTHSLLSTLEIRLDPVASRAVQIASEMKTVSDDVTHVAKSLETQYQINERIRQILDSLVV